MPIHVTTHTAHIHTAAAPVQDLWGTGRLNVAIHSSNNTGAVYNATSEISVSVGVFTAPLVTSTALTARELLSADDTNIIKLGSDDKLFAAPIELEDSNFLANYLLARG